MIDLEYLHKHVKMKLTPNRYRHSLAVQKQAVRLSAIHGGDWYQAAAAGLIHDVCRDMDPDAQLNYLRCYGIMLDILTMDHPAVWHSICAPVYARETLGIRDQEILDAVRYHTTGRRAMGQLEKILYVADLTSEDRIFPGVEEYRVAAQTSLDAVMSKSLHHTLSTLIRQEKSLLPDAWEAYNYYLHSDCNGERSRVHDIH